MRTIIRNFRKVDKLILFFSVLMFIFGLLMIFSASYVRAIDFNNDAFYYLKRQGLALGMCLIAFAVVVNVPLKAYRITYIPIIIVSALSLYMLFYFGGTVNGATSWYSVGGLSIQPSEFVKIGLILFIAEYYNRYKNNKDSIIHFLVPILPIFIILICVFKQPDFGTAVIMGLISFFMICMVPKYPVIKKFFIKCVIGLSFLGVFSIVFIYNYGSNILYSYQLNRLNISNPCARYTEVGTGYQVCNAYIAINNGGLFGAGFGDSTQKYLYLPESHTDAIFPVIVEECGLVVGVVLLVIYGLIIFRILKIAARSNLYGGLVCYGVAVYFVSHVVINLGGIFGLIPLTGVPLPFLSYGGTFALCTTICLSLVHRVNIENRILKDNEQIKNKLMEI